MRQTGQPQICSSIFGTGFAELRAAQRNRFNVEYSVLEGSATDDVGISDKSSQAGGGSVAQFAVQEEIAARSGCDMAQMVIAYKQGMYAGRTRRRKGWIFPQMKCDSCARKWQCARRK